MIIGALRVELALFDARTLKDKRRVMLSLKQRLRNRFNVSVAEVGYSQTPKRSCLGVVIVSDQSRAVHAQLDKVIDVVRQTVGVSLLTYHRELL